jgi:hypothetical protein
MTPDDRLGAGIFLFSALLLSEDVLGFSSPIAAQGIQKFSSWASRSASMFDVAKLAEGSYGEEDSIAL